ncbi:alpha/beta fold hydrolase [Brevibacterium litoralis]|uniref:alpha/beta fold hydrolase n=1 Tax=Brevibacterium litoralis TaxID=3138935 RepID=UPI0032EDC80B
MTDGPTPSSTDTRYRTAAYRLPGLQVEEFSVPVPLDHFGTGAGADLVAGTGGKGASGAGEVWELNVFARVVGEPGSTKPFLLYLQGGPGHEAFRPTKSEPAWLPRALEDYRVVMLDQRGTGRSGAIGEVAGRVTGVPAALAQAPDSDAGVVALAEHLMHYRADAIVEDAEVVRKALSIDTWSVLGQSFGGFCTLRYLNEHPDSLAEAFFTGGLPAVDVPLSEVYSTTWNGMRGKSRDFAARYPQTSPALRAASERAAAGDLVLPDGTVVTPAHIRSLGHYLGATGGAEKLVYLLENPVDSAAFRHDLQAALPFGARNPLYAVVHESCWANGGATQWAGAHAMPADFAEDPTLLSGEHIFPEFFASGPLAFWRDVADVLTEVEWPVLWEPAKLREAQVPVAAAAYYADAFVPLQYSEPTAALLPQAQVWVTNEYEHNGLRASGGHVIDHLIGLVRGS